MIFETVVNLVQWSLEAGRHEKDEDIGGAKPKAMEERKVPFLGLREVILQIGENEDELMSSILSASQTTNGPDRVDSEGNIVVG
ncbi:hypothetical protein C2S52_013902 [Perilla frutescens var. hirtella]|nr:hypothetical protein C2S51_016152 [Perilla frutescens var. frutescens]KAH6776341.1 hypothetical protein C2S52_013902 [Perilla frutescens var. hirtella]